MAKLTRGKGPLTGVSAGLAKQMNLSPGLVRVLWVVLSIVFPVAILVYFGMAIALPKENPPLITNDGRGQHGGNIAEANTLFCRNCGTKNNAEAKFCRSCGKSLA